MSKKYTVYKHTSPSGKVYIGYTSQRNVKHRWNNGKGYIGNDYFSKAIDKYGWDNFSHQILFVGSSESEAKEKEIFYISLYDSTDRSKGYNITKGGEGFNGYHHTEECKVRISEKLKGVKKTKEHSSRISSAKKGTIISDSWKQNISKGKLGSVPWNKGIKYSDEQKQSLGKAVLVYDYKTKDFLCRFRSIGECAKYFGVSSTNVGDCLGNRTKSFKKKLYFARYE